MLERRRAGRDPRQSRVPGDRPRRLLARSTVPVLVTQGRADSVVLPAMAEHVLATCPTAEASGMKASATCRTWRSPSASTASSPRSPDVSQGSRHEERARTAHTQPQADPRGGGHRRGCRRTRPRGRHRCAAGGRPASARRRPHESLRADLRAAAVRRAECSGRGRAGRARQAEWAARCERPAGGRAGAADRRFVAECEQPEQPLADGRHDVRGPVPRPRHDLRHHVAARQPTTPGARPKPATPASTSTRSTAAARWPTRQLYDPADRAKFTGRERRPVRGPAARGPDARSSPTRATTRT